ncbi:MAG: endonuclease III [Eubacteriales bacterium]|nr:endonuclease III [Eubacteriales bacterium]
MQAKAKGILVALDELYPTAGPELHFNNPYETLVAVMLSAQCTDKQVNKVTPAVFQKYPDIASMAAITPQELFPLVKSCGFHKKAENIVNTCKLIEEKFGGKIPESIEELVTLPGVGRKTANVVVSNAFGIPAIAVDTHVFRVSNRLGLADSKDVLNTEKQLMKAIPRERWSKAHHQLILHGRYVCAARKPKCAECGLKSLCKSFEKNV